MAGMLIITSHLPEPAMGGSSARLAEVMKRFHRRGTEIDLLHVTRWRQDLSALPVVRECVRSVEFLSLRGRMLVGPLPKVTRSMARPPKLLTARFAQRALHALRPPLSIEDTIARMIDRVQPEIVWLDHTWLAPLLVNVPRRVPAMWVCDTHDVLHLRDESRQRAGMAGETDISRAEEIALLRPFDLVLAIQEEERRVLAEMLPRHRVAALGHMCECRPMRSTRDSILFVGGKIDLNVRGLLTFVAEAWPAIAARCPDARLEIAGGICGVSEIARLATGSGGRITLVGKFERSEDVYDGPAAMICPLWAGSGLKIKMVEALAHGKATVGTPVAAQGLTDGANRAFVLARTAQDFVAPLVQFLEDAAHRRRWETAAVMFANSRFSADSVWQETDAKLASLLGRSLGSRFADKRSVACAA
jgi:glycosyltransferase involved in cell wall biosynthesis